MIFRNNLAEVVKGGTTAVLALGYYAFLGVATGMALFMYYRTAARQLSELE